jgi:hypothetical protein
MYHLEQTKLRRLREKLAELVCLQKRWSQTDAARSLDDLRAQSDLIRLAIIALEALDGVSGVSRQAAKTTATTTAAAIATGQHR